MFKLFKRQARCGPHSLNIILAQRGGASKVYQVDMAMIRFGMACASCVLMLCLAWVGFMTYRHVSLQDEVANLNQTKARLARLQQDQLQQQQKDAQTLGYVQTIDSRIKQLESQLNRLNTRQRSVAGRGRAPQLLDGVGGGVDINSWQQDQEKTDMLKAWRSQLDELTQKLDQASAMPRGTPVNMGVARMSSPFGYRLNPFTNRGREFHNGLDFAADYGTAVKATADGRVVDAGWMGGLGQAVRIDHGYAYQTAVGHLSRISVKVGDRVKAGDIIGQVGSTGRSSGPHVHYIVYRNGQAVNPEPFI